MCAVCDETCAGTTTSVNVSTVRSHQLNRLRRWCWLDPLCRHIRHSQPPFDVIHPSSLHIYPQMRTRKRMPVLCQRGHLRVHRHCFIMYCVWSTGWIYVDMVFTPGGPKGDERNARKKDTLTFFENFSTSDLSFGYHRLQYQYWRVQCEPTIGLTRLLVFTEDQPFGYFDAPCC